MCHILSICYVFFRGSNNSLLSESPSRDSSSPRASPLPRTGNMTASLAKRWNSSTTIDSASPATSSTSNGGVGQSRFSNKSLVNLTLRQSRQK